MIPILPALVLAYVGTNPVQISACSLSDEVVPVTSGDAQSQEIVGSQLFLQFVNTTAEPLSAVSFTVTANGKTLTVFDKGTFSQGTVISHYFREERMDTEKASCRVTAATFADGTSWSPPLNAER